MKIIRKIGLILIFAISLHLVSGIVKAEVDTTDISVISGCNGIDASVPVLGSEQLMDNMQSAFLYEVTTGTLMYAYNPDQQIHPAGLVKILTGIVAIENGNLSDAITVKAEVIELISESSRTSKLKEGEVFTLEQLLYCLLVEGSNDAALIIADHIAGSQEAFVSRMNKYAMDLGCSNSHFTNVHGLHDQAQLTTARDVSRIVDAAIQNEQFSIIFGTTHYELTKTNKSDSRYLETSNHLMHKSLYEIYYDSRITGGRTGVNNMGLNNIVTTAEQDGMKIITVVCGSASKVNDRAIVEKIGGFDETSKLLDQCFENYTTGQLLLDGQALKQYSVRNGSADVVVGASVTISSVIPKDNTSTAITYQYEDNEKAFEAPVEKGRHMSSVQIWCGSVCLAQADLYAMNNVQINYQQVEYNDGSGLSWWGILLLVVFLAAGMCIVALFSFRYVNIRKNTNRRNDARRSAVRRR